MGNNQVVFLIDLSLENGYEKLKDYFEESAGKHSKRLDFDLYETVYSVPRRFLIGTMSGRLTWGGDKEIRPLGVHTDEYSVFGSGAITFIDYMKIVNTLSEIKYKRGPEYIVEPTDEIISMLNEDGYRSVHRPYFAMMGSSHKLITVDPLSATFVDAGCVKGNRTPTDEFAAEYKECLLPEIHMDFGTFKGRVKDTPDCTQLVFDEAGNIHDVSESLSGIAKLPEGATRIKSTAFINQMYITDLVLPQGLEVIEFEAFWGCASLNRLYIPKSVKQIHKAAFPVMNIHNIYFEGTEEAWKALVNVEPITKKGERNGYAKYRNPWNDEFIEYAFECKF